jgi:hypothetical protein
MKFAVANRKLQTENRQLLFYGGNHLMQNVEAIVSFEVRLTNGRRGTDPQAPDWEVRELINGVINNEAEIYDNLTKAEAEDLAAMWMRKKAEAEA